MTYTERFDPGIERSTISPKRNWASLIALYTTSPSTYEKRKGYYNKRVEWLIDDIRSGKLKVTKEMMREVRRVDHIRKIVIEAACLRGLGQ